MKNKSIILVKRPLGKPDLSDFKIIEGDIPSHDESEILLKTIYVSVDPYLRGRMNDTKSYVPPFQIGKPIESGIIAEVVESHHSEFRKGDYVSGNLGWHEYQLSDGNGLQKINATGIPLSAYLGAVGMTGLTAYFGLTKIGSPKEGETIVVSGAGGAVGMVVGQIGKILKCNVIGITGSDEKADFLMDKLKFDQAINYKKVNNLKEELTRACPQGVDIYFDNVGGEISDTVLTLINKHARIVVCGAISLYNTTERPLGPRVAPILVVKSSLMQGFIVSDFKDHFSEGIKQLSDWIKEDKLISRETIIHGFDHIPQAFLDLFDGKNEGKMLVKV